MSTWLVNLDQVRTICGLQQGVENRKLESARDTAHQRLRKMMGATGYNLLIAAVAADNDLSSPSNATWLALMTGDNTTGASITKYLARLTHHIALAGFHSEPTKTGLHAKSGQDYETVDGKIMGMHEARTRDAYQLEEELLLSHLDNNLSLYPWKSTTVPGEERVTKARRSGGFVFERTGRTEHYGIPRDTNNTSRLENG